MQPHDTTQHAPKLCECGCGQPAPIAKRTITKKGHVKGQPIRFIKGHKIRIPVESRLWDKVRKTETCWLWIGGISASGYGVLEIPGKPRRSAPVHRLSWELHHGQIPDSLQVLHRCDIRSCVNPEHLFLGSQADNVHDCIAKGRSRFGLPPVHRGDDNGNSKLTAEQVQSIRLEYATGKTSSLKLAAKYGVSKSTILCVIRRETWAHI